ncbi:PIG-L deacetylase family protein [Pararhodonellum marinum]|uniref:PIG-L deacetylase family protein n=1 Tax=Pararhodonellum marinum TaxID=2755358 RepID=UPI00188E8291|nr:PIG-L deacetylase family protein [Pararhodonellum marinum]
MSKNILIAAPHPDDEILGCGGLITKLVDNGDNVYVAIMTNGNIGAPEIFPIEGTLRGRREALNSHKLLGVRDTFFFDFPAPRLDAEPSYKISIALTKLIDSLKIDWLFVPHRGDIHKDHRIVYEASLVAARPVNAHKVKKILAYETLSETEWAAPFGDDMFIPNIFFEISESQLQKKIEAFDCFSPPRLKEFPHSRSLDGVRTLARYRGSIISKPFAEAFMLVREIEEI